MAARQITASKSYAPGLPPLMLATEKIAQLSTSLPLDCRTSHVPRRHYYRLSPMSVHHAPSMRHAHLTVSRASTVSSCARTRCWRSSPYHHPILCLLTHNSPHPPTLF